MFYISSDYNPERDKHRPRSARVCETRALHVADAALRVIVRVATVFAGHWEVLEHCVDCTSCSGKRCKEGPGTWWFDLVGSKRRLCAAWFISCQLRRYSLMAKHAEAAD